MEEYAWKRMPMLKSDNWLSWKCKMEILLKHLNFWSFVDPKNDNGSLNKHEALDAKIHNIITLSVDDTLMPLIQNCSTSKQLWRTLCKHFNDDTGVDEFISYQIQNDSIVTTKPSQNNKEKTFGNISATINVEELSFEQTLRIFENCQIKFIQILSNAENESLLSNYVQKLKQICFDFLQELENFSKYDRLEFESRNRKQVDWDKVHDVSKIDKNHKVNFKLKNPINMQKSISNVSKSQIIEFDDELSDEAVKDKNKNVYEKIQVKQNIYDEINKKDMLMSEITKNLRKSDKFLETNVLSTSSSYEVTSPDEQRLNNRKSTLDEIAVCIHNPRDNSLDGNNTNNSKNKSHLETHKNVETWFKTNDLTLWSRLLLLKPSFLLNLEKFYAAYHSDIYWLFDRDGKAYKYGHQNIYQEDINQINDPEEVVELSYQNVKRVIRGKKCLFFMFLTEDGRLFGVGDNSYGQLGIGSKARQLKPVLVATDIDKVSCGFAHTLVLNNCGQLLTCGSNQYGEINWDNDKKLVLSETKDFCNKSILDISCCRNASIILTKNKEVYVCGMLNELKLNGPTLVSFNFKVNHVIGGINEFIVLSEDQQAHFCYLNKEQMQIAKTKIDIKEPVLECFNEFNSGNFVLVTGDGRCSLWKNQDRILLSTKLKSISDIVSIYAMSQTLTLTYLPSELFANTEIMLQLNNPLQADIIFKIDMKPIYAHRVILMKRSNYLREKLTHGEWKHKYPVEIDDYSFATFYSYMRYIYNMTKILDLKILLPQLRQLADNFQDEDFKSFLACI